MSLQGKHALHGVSADRHLRENPYACKVVAHPALLKKAKRGSKTFGYIQVGDEKGGIEAKPLTQRGCDADPNGKKTLVNANIIGEAAVMPEGIPTPNEL